MTEQSFQNHAAGDQPRIDLLIRRAARPFAVEGWRPTSSGLLFHGPEGHWGRIQLELGVAWSPALEKGLETLSTDALLEMARWAFPRRPSIRISAGVASPYLLRVVNRRDRDRPPPPGYEHALVLHQVEATFDVGATTLPPPLTLPQPMWAETGILIGPDRAEAWFTSVFGLLTPAITDLSSEDAIRDHLLKTAGPTDDLSIRYAILLTKHLGRTGELPALIDLAARTSEALDAFAASSGGQTHRNDRDSNMLMWTHRRFERFLESAP